MNWIEKIRMAIQGNKGSIELDVPIINIPKEIYIKELAVYSAVSLIANAISQSEIKVYENGASVKNEDYFSLNIKPNPNESASQFWHKVTEKALRSDRGALCFVSRRKLYCADNFVLEEKRPFLGNIYSGVSVDDFQLQKKFYADEVFLFKLENIQAKNLIDELYNSVGEAIGVALQSYKETNTKKYIFRIDGVQAGDEEFNKEFETVLRNQLKNFVSGEGQIYIEFAGRKLDPMKQEGQQKNSDDIVKLIEEIFKVTGKAFKIPESLMLGNITNMNDVVKSFLTFAVDPFADMIGQVLTAQYGFENWTQGNYYRVDTSKVNHIDIFDMADKIDKLISSSFACIDEVREKAGLDILGEEWSQRHLLTKNYEYIDQKKIMGGEES